MKRWILAPILALVAGLTLTATDGPLTNAMNLRVRSDSNGYLLASAGSPGSDGPLTAFGNIRLRTDENGYLRVAITGAAPTDATYITQTTNSTLSAEQALGSLATGILKSTTTTGVVSIAAAGTDYQAPITGTDTRVCFFDGTAVSCNDAGLAYNKTTDALTVVGTTTTAGVGIGTAGVSGKVLTPVVSWDNGNVTIGTTGSGDVVITPASGAVTMPDSTYIYAGGLVGVGDSALYIQTIGSGVNANINISAAYAVGIASFGAGTQISAAGDVDVLSTTKFHVQTDSDGTPHDFYFNENGTATFPGSVTATDFLAGAAGVKLTGANGALTFLGLGDGTDEDLTLNLNSANVATVSSSTGVLKIDNGTIITEGKFNSSDGTVGVTVTTCTGFKDGLCISGA